MTKEELIQKLKDLDQMADTEVAHSRMEDALLEYINDEDITKAFNETDRWYA